VPIGRSSAAGDHGAKGDEQKGWGPAMHEGGG
jgi:hypothetical protein